MMATLTTTRTVGTPTPLAMPGLMPPVMLITTSPIIVGTSARVSAVATAVVVVAVAEGTMSMDEAVVVVITVSSTLPAKGSPGEGRDGKKQELVERQRLLLPVQHQSQGRPQAGLESILSTSTISWMHACG
jgi:hypothetical protein